MFLRSGVLLGVLFVASGCTNQRMLTELQEYKAENKRLSLELQAIGEEVGIVMKQRDAAVMELQRSEEQKVGMEMQLRDFSLGHLFTVDRDRLLLDGLAFRRGSAELTDEAKRSVQVLARKLREPSHKMRHVSVLGHTDNVPVTSRANVERFKNNWGLSAMRAASVLTALEHAGVDSNRLRGGFLGEHAPLETNASATGRKANRRVEILLH